MKQIFNCRRSSLALIGMLILGASLIWGKYDTSAAIAMICMGVAGANAFEKKAKK